MVIKNFSRLITVIFIGLSMFGCTSSDSSNQSNIPSSGSGSNTNSGSKAPVINPPELKDVVLETKFSSIPELNKYSDSQNLPVYSISKVSVDITKSNIIMDNFFNFEISLEEGFAESTISLAQNPEISCKVTTSVGGLEKQINSNSIEGTIILLPDTKEEVTNCENVYNASVKEDLVLKITNFNNKYMNNYLGASSITIFMQH
jgi:hypothetical protein